MATNNSEVNSCVGDESPNDEIDDSEETLIDNHSDSDAHTSSYDSSDEDSSDEDIDELELKKLKDYQKLSCSKCGRIVSSQHHIKYHKRSKA